MQAYRSGHNEAVLKTVWVKAHGGSNPSACAKKGRSCCSALFWRKWGGRKNARIIGGSREERKTERKGKRTRVVERRRFAVSQTPSLRAKKPTNFNKKLVGFVFQIGGNLFVRYPVQAERLFRPKRIFHSSCADERTRRVNTRFVRLPSGNRPLPTLQ